MFSINTNSEKNSLLNKNLNIKFDSVETQDIFSQLDPHIIVPDLVDVQRTSFKNFILSGLYKALKKKSQLLLKKNKETLEIVFFPEWLQFKKPELNSKKAIFYGKTYGSSVYIPILVKNSGWKKNKIEWLLLGFLPLLTNEGHFIINGIPRVVLHQMIRNPGVYVLAKDSRTGLPTVRIVPKQGSWINISLDKNHRLWFKTQLFRRKISILIILQALGFSLDYIRSTLNDFEKDLNYLEVLELNKVKNLTETGKTVHDQLLLRAGLSGHPSTQQEAQKYLYSHFIQYISKTEQDKITEKEAQDFFWNKVWSTKNRKLGYIGRKQFSEKLKSPVSLTEIHLEKDDILVATKAALKLLFQEHATDDIDSLNNKRIRGCGEFLYDELDRSLQELEVLLSRKFTNIPTKECETFWPLNRSIIGKYVSKSWKSFFTGGTLSQFMDETNPLAETTHKRRLTVLGPGGVSSNQTTIQIRGIHPTYYGRLCPIETPEGKNAGLVNSFTLSTQRNSQGQLETPFFEVYKGQVQKELQASFFSAEKESSFVLAPADICVSYWNQLPKTKLPVRKNWNFEYALWNKITKQSIDHLQMISVATSLIPFLEHDDANRALMGSNMQRQAVPVIRPESALVRTGLETRVIADVNHGLRSFKTGYVTAVDATKIQIFKRKNYSFPTSTLKKLVDESKKEWTASIDFSSLCYRVTKRTLSPLNIYKPIKKQKKEKLFFTNLTFVSKNKQFSFFSKNGNFFQFSTTEPCFLENKKESKKTISDKYEYLSFLSTYQRTNQSTCNTQKPNIKQGDWIQITDLISDGAASSRGNLAIGKNVLIGYVPWEGYNFEDAILISENLVQKELFTSLHIDYYEVEVKNTQYGLETITNKVPLEIDASSKEILGVQSLNSKGIIEIGTWVQEGDYLVGKISPLKPKGPSIQQQYEKLYNVIMQRENTSFKNTSLRVPKGVEGFVLDVQVLPPTEADVLPLAPKNSILRVRIALLQKRNIQVGDKMAGRHGNKGVISKILPCQDMPYLPDGTPLDIVLNPLGVPSRMNVGQILEGLLGLAGKYLNESYTIQLFDEKFGAEASRSLVYSKLYEASLKTANPWLFEPAHPGKIKVFDGRTGESFDQPVTVGYPYMLKLIHLVDDKIHARSTGPYSAVTQQPVKGRARNGGQRLGEMEVWALQAYGAAYTLQELLTIKSDDIDGRKDAVFKIYTNQSFKLGYPESFKVLLRELQALCFNLKLYQFE